MLKNRMLVLLVAILGLAACSNKENTSKSDGESILADYEEYVYELKTDEIEELSEKIDLNFQQISYVDIETKTIERGSLYENETISKTRRENNRNVCSIKTTTTSSSKKKGIHLTTQTSSETFYVSIGKSTVCYSINQDNEQSVKFIHSYDNASDADAEIVRRVGRLIFDTYRFMWLKKQDGSFGITVTSQSLQYEAVPWGNETKVLYNLNEALYKYTVNTDGFVTDYIEKSQIVTNRDSTTGEWFSENIVVLSTETTCKFSYGGPIENSNSTAVFNALCSNAFIAHLSVTSQTLNGNSVIESNSVNIQSQKNGLYKREITLDSLVLFYEGTHLVMEVNVWVAKMDSSNTLVFEEHIIPLKLNPNLMGDYSYLFDSSFDGLKYIDSYSAYLSITISFNVVLYTNGTVKCEITHLSCY